MSTKKPKMDTFDALVKEVTKEPYRMSLPGGDILVVNQPTWRQVNETQEAMAEGGVDFKDQLQSLIGEAGWAMVEPHLMDQPAEAIGALVQRIVKHFGYDLGEGVSPT